ncbi:hypothetical protein HD806DRAFT_114696 [Xylariaceae sp. AK1471]|nr:hypothetical protein HD806DRAFT_114696 [Xylariaceae sp. AK1471]
MAELIGLIGGSIALVELVGKVSACILTLKSLLTEIKDVSNKLSALIREVEILEPVVEAMSREFNDNDNNLVNWSDPTVLLSIEYCEKALDDLNIVLGDLVQEINASKKLKRYKATMKAIINKNVLDRCHTRLQSAVRLLSLTQQWYIITLLKVQPTVIVERLSHQGFVYRPESTINAQAKPVSETARTLPRHLQSIKRSFATQVVREEWGTPRFTNMWNFGPLGSISWRYYQDGKRPNPKNFNLIAQLRANYWFASRVWDIQASRAVTGWTLKLNTYCVQLDTAPVFCYARNGDIAGILRLVDQGKASLQDHTPSGQSLMHLAREYGHLDLFKVLVASGLDLLELENNLRVMPCEVMLVCGIHRGIDTSALHQFYVENDIYIDCGLLLSPTCPGYIFEAMSIGSPEAFKNIIPSVLPRFHERLDLEERIKYCSFDTPDAYPDTLRLMINANCGIRQEDISNLQQKHVCLLALVAFRYGPMTMRGTSYHARPWRKLSQEVIYMTDDLSFQGFGLDPTFQSGEFSNKGLKFNPVLEFLRRNQPLTPLFTALSYFRWETQEHQVPTCIRDLKRIMQTTLIWWLEDLAACQVDLMRYGRRERRIFLRNEKLKQAWYYCGSRVEHEQSPISIFEDKVRLVDFDYGAKPSDWRLHWDTEIERYVGDFWSSVENLLPHSPGS